MFPKGVPNSTSLQSHMFCPKSSPFLIKGDTLHLSIESSILGSHHSFNFCFLVIDQSNWLIATEKKKKKAGLVRHPQLINVKQNNKYPQNKHPFFSSFWKHPPQIAFKKKEKKKKPQNALLEIFVYHTTVVASTLVCRINK